MSDYSETIAGLEALKRRAALLSERVDSVAALAERALFHLERVPPPVMDLAASDEDRAAVRESTHHYASAVNALRALRAAVDPAPEAAPVPSANVLDFAAHRAARRTR